MLAPDDTTLRPTSIAPDGTVEGYASLFGELDQARDMVMPGAFAASLQRRGVRRVPMLFQHDPAEPIGVWLDLHEDALGLYSRGRLIPEVVRARELIALLKAGTADGLSIGFRTIKGRRDPKTRIRRLEAIDLWEISIVMFPLLAGARVRAVKDAGLALASEASGERKSVQARVLARGAHGGCEPVKVSAARPVAARTAGATHRAAPLDASAQRFHPERLFRREPRFDFGRGDGRMRWRDVTLSERALRAGWRGRAGA
jgi:HK97 family phage prohead protease